MQFSLFSWWLLVELGDVLGFGRVFFNLLKFALHTMLGISYYVIMK